MSCKIARHCIKNDFNKKQPAWASYGHIAALLEYQKLLTRQFNGG